MGKQGLCLKHYYLLPNRGYRDATDAQVHLKRLRAMGYTLDMLSDITGLHRDTLTNLGAWTDLGGIEMNTHNGIMHVPIPEEFIETGSRIANVGTRRRIRALMRSGYPGLDLADRLGVKESQLSQWMRNDFVTAATANRVKRLFEELQFTPGKSRRSILAAERKGWALPMQWDEDTIDDPDAEPDMNERLQKKGAGWWHEMYWELRDMGVADTSVIAKRLSVPFPTVQQQVKRWKSQGRL